MVVIEGLWLFLNILILWYLCGGLVVELSDKVKEFIVKTIKEEILRILPLTVVTKEDLRLAIEAMNKRFEDLQKYMDKRFEDLQKYMDRRFEAVDKRFESIDRRFEDLQKYMDRRLDAVDRHFESIDRRFEDLLNYMDKRFEAVDRRFEDMNRRFDGLVRLLQIMFIVLSLLIAVFGFLRAAM